MHTPELGAQADDTPTPQRRQSEEGTPSNPPLPPPGSDWKAILAGQASAMLTTICTHAWQFGFLLLVAAFVLAFFMGKIPIK